MLVELFFEWCGKMITAQTISPESLTLQSNELKCRQQETGARNLLSRNLLRQTAKLSERIRSVE